MVKLQPFFGTFRDGWPITDMLGMVLANRAAAERKKQKKADEIKARLKALGRRARLAEVSIIWDENQ